MLTVGMILFLMIVLMFAETTHGAFITRPAGHIDTTLAPVEQVSPQMQEEIDEDIALAKATRREMDQNIDEAIERAKIEELQKMVVQLTKLLNELLAQR